MGGLRLKLVSRNLVSFSMTCDVKEPRNTRLCASGTPRYRDNTEDYFSELSLRELFMPVPRPKQLLHGSQNRVQRYQLVEASISLLLRLLHPDMHEIHMIIYKKHEDQIKNLEKELRILLTVLGDTSLLLCADEHEEFQKLLAEFEAVANEAGILIHSLLFSYDQAFAKVDESLGVVLHHIHLLQADIMKFLNLLPFINRAHVTPRTSVVDSLLIVDSLIYDLEDLIKREDNRIAALKDQIKTLHQVLISLRSSVKHIGSPKPSEIGELKEPLKRTGDMAHEVEYLIISFLVGDAPQWYLVNRLTDLNQKIEFIGTELKEITKKYEFGDLKVAKYFSTQLSLQPNRNLEVDEVIVGFEDEATDILDQLVGGREHLHVISIYGMPGVGKTTLAKKLFDHPSVKYRFDKLLWCVISQTYQSQSILTDILIHLKSEFDKDSILKMDKKGLVEHIYKSLKGRRYLIVLDDIWDSNVWDDLGRCFPDDGNGSRVLFTSRNKDVAPSNSTVYEQPLLSNIQCWELLEKKVFGSKRCPPELLGIGKTIAANCKGLPLAVVVIAGILSTADKKKNTWEEVGKNLASYIFYDGDNSSMMQILELSYKHLPDHLKPCFLYFASFKEDQEIPIRKLMRLWIAEGFLRKEEEKSAENVAEEYLMELIDKSLVMVAKLRSDGGVRACVIHDLLRDLCLKLCVEENFLKFEKSNINLMSLQHETRQQASTQYATTWSSCQHVRSFRGSWLTSILYVRDMRLLRILDFGSRIRHLIGLEYLVNLRYLVISYLVPSISRLVNLEYLCVEKTNEVLYLPSAIMEMKKLRYLHMESEARYGEDWNSSQTNNLEFLSNVWIWGVKDAEMLKCSSHLRKLKLTTYRHVDFSFLTQLESLNITFNGFGILGGFSFPSNIKKLTLCGRFRLRFLEMSIIGRLKNLEIFKCRSVSFEDERWDTRDGEFQKLRFLKLDNIRNLTQWNVALSEHFPRLQQLVLRDCDNLGEIPTEIGEIATLEMIEVQGRCLKSLVKSAKRIQQEQLDFGNEELRIILSVERWILNAVELESS